MKALVVHPLYTHTLPGKSAAYTRGSWEQLPLDVLSRICAYIDTAKDMCCFGQLNKSCRMAASDDRYWRELCVTKFFVPQHSEPVTWKELYRFNHEFFYEVVLLGYQAKSGLDRFGYVGPMVIPISVFS